MVNKTLDKKSFLGFRYVIEKTESKRINRIEVEIIIFYSMML